MVTMPPEFVQLSKYPGYYWNIVDHRLYSIKVHGVLLPMKMTPAYHGPTKTGAMIDYGDGYRVSFKGRRVFIPLEWLMKLTAHAQQTIPVYETAKDIRRSK